MDRRDRCSVESIVLQQKNRLAEQGHAAQYIVMSRLCYDQLIGEVYGDLAAMVKLNHPGECRHCVVMLLGLPIVVVNGPAEMLAVVTNPIDQFLYGDRLAETPVTREPA